MRKIYTKCILTLPQKNKILLSLEKNMDFLGSVRDIFASLFLSLKDSTCGTKENVFYFTSKALFLLEKIKF